MIQTTDADLFTLWSFLAVCRHSLARLDCLNGIDPPCLFMALFYAKTRFDLQVDCSYCLKSVGRRFFRVFAGEFIFVPMVTATAAIAALVFGVQSRRRFISYILVLIGLGVSRWQVLSFGDVILDTLSRGNQGYAELS